MCRDYYDLDFMDRSVDTAPIAPALRAFFDDVLEASVAELNFKAIVDGLGAVLFEYPFRCAACLVLVVWFRRFDVLEALSTAHPTATPPTPPPSPALNATPPPQTPPPPPKQTSVPAYYALILRSLTVLEGLALSADPGYKLLARAYPYMARRLLTDPAPQLRGAFEELVIQVCVFLLFRIVLRCVLFV
jgi:predicted unusual protein kinase regulating ubiquinone biosynthesis (AarF/ABC1/UbiB family)